MPFQAQPISNKVITWDEYYASGCPVCKSGNKLGYPLVQGVTTLVVCSECKVAYEINNKKALAKKD